MALDDHGREQTATPIRPAIDGSDVRELTAADIPRIATALARAFEDDPVLSWIFRSESDRLNRLESAFALYLRRIWLPHQACYGTDRLFGAALWLPPGKWHLSPWQQLRLLPSMLAVSTRDLPRLVSVLQLIEKKHPREPPHFYLAVLGVEPEFQGRGFGGALMQPVLERCDREGVPAYLESSKRRNIVLYERHGFRVVEELRVPRGGPPIWPMWRDPARPRAT
jgi:ribosomal protein S18 acetylase RimI-like enzyme